MAAELLKFFLSGGASNADPALSLGGVESSVELLSQTVTFDGSGIAGITLIDGDANADGVGTLEYFTATTSVRWTKPGGAAAGATELVDISADGNYVIVAPEGIGHVTIAVVAASLPGTDTSDTVTVSSILSNLLHNITDTNQSLNGHTDFACFYLRNESGVNKRVRLWIEQNFAPTTLWIGTTTTTSGSTESTIADETTAPAGVTFVVHNAIGNALDLTVNASQSIGIWLKREVEPLTGQSNPTNFGFIKADVTDL